jgi:hypothetical protein
LKSSLACPQLGGGWRLRLNGRDLETGVRVAASFQSNPVKTKETSPLTPCKPAKNGWMRIVEVDEIQN